MFIYAIFVKQKKQSHGVALNLKFYHRKEFPLIEEGKIFKQFSDELFLVRVHYGMSGNDIIGLLTNHVDSLGSDAIYSIPIDTSKWYIGAIAKKNKLYGLKLDDLTEEDSKFLNLDSDVRNNICHLSYYLLMIESDKSEKTRKLEIEKYSLTDRYSQYKSENEEKITIYGKARNKIVETKCKYSRFTYNDLEQDSLFKKTLDLLGFELLFRINNKLSNGITRNEFETFENIIEIIFIGDLNWKQKIKYNMDLKFYNHFIVPRLYWDKNFDYKKSEYFLRRKPVDNDKKYYEKELIIENIKDELENEETVKELMKQIYNEKTLTKVQQEAIIERALKVAESSNDYLNIATNVSHDEVLANKSWGRNLFEKAFEKLEIEHSAQDLYSIARNIAANEQLGDKKWAKEIYIDAIKKADYIDDLTTISYCVSDPTDINDKGLAKIALEKALKLSSESYEQIQIAEAIASDEVISDKYWARAIIESIEENISYDEYERIALLYAHNKLLNDKNLGRIWFEKAIEFKRNYDKQDFSEIASIIYNPEILNDKEWAADLCMESYKNVQDIPTLINMSMLTFQCSIEQAKEIIIYAIDLIENDEYYTSDHIFTIAAYVANQEICNLPFLNDKVWGEKLFLKAIEKADTKEKKDLIQEKMSKYL